MELAIKIYIGLDLTFLMFGLKFRQYYQWKVEGEILLTSNIRHSYRLLNII